MTGTGDDTIFALSSGSPPAAIAVVRISGPAAARALQALAGRLPPPRRAVSMTLRDEACDLLDRALVLWLPGPATATGEDTAELHLHGGRAVIAAVERALAALPGLRPARPGEFTRRAFVHGKVDLVEAEGLADLLAAETELQRQAAIRAVGGLLSAEVAGWRDRVLHLSAELEAALDFSDDDDVAALPQSFTWNIAGLGEEIGTRLAAPRAELLREGLRVVLAGPPNAGKSTLFNALVEAEAAITSPVAGTTRDVIARPVAIEGIPLLFIDTAGLRTDGSDEIERVGIERASAELDRADLILWLGPDAEAPAGAWPVAPKADLDLAGHTDSARHRVSAVTGEGIATLRKAIVVHARQAMPRPGEAALNQRQARLLGEARDALTTTETITDPLLLAEHLRLARIAFDRLLGRASTEDMLDTLFSRFCIGK